MNFPLRSSEIIRALPVRGIPHLALPMANFELAEGQKLQSETVDFDVGGEHGSYAGGHYIHDVVGFAVGTQVERLANQSCNNVVSDHRDW